MATASIMFRWRWHIVTWLLVSCCGLSSAGVAQAQPEDDTERIEVSAEDSIEVRRGGDAVEAKGKRGDPATGVGFRSGLRGDRPTEAEVARRGFGLSP